jgi:hypothetical protein
MVDHHRAQLQAFDFGVGVGKRLPDERRDGHRIGGRHQEVVNLATEPDEHRDEKDERERKSPIARKVIA